MFGSHENQSKTEIPNFVFYREIKIIFISIKIGGKCQHGILKYLLNIIFINLFAMLVSNVPTVQLCTPLATYIFSVTKLTLGTKLTQVKNSKDQIDCYQNVGTKLTVTPKCKDQNGVFT